MPLYLIYSDSTGDVLRRAECPESMSDGLARPGEQVLAVAELPAFDAAYIDGEQVIEAPPVPCEVSTLTIVADGADVARFTGLPAGWHASVDGVDVAPGGSEWAFATAVAGETVIRFYAPRHAMREIRITAADGGLRAVLVRRAKDERDRRIGAGFVWDGSDFNSDEVSQSRLLGLFVSAQSAPGAFPVRWRLANNTWREMSPADAVAVFGALQAHLQHHFERFRAVESMIAALPADQLAAFDPAAHW